jgi:hypothetical protein
MMLRFKRILVGLMATFAIGVVSVKVVHLDKNPHVLNVFARMNFNEQYYLETYPDVKKSGMDAFDHYTAVGWKEDRTPRKDMDVQLYKKMNHSYKDSNLNPLQHMTRSKMLFKTVYTNPSEMLVATPLDNPKYNLALVAIFRNEAPFLKEWIEFYKLMGVEHMYLYNHLSTDNYMAVLDPYIKEGFIELTHLTEEPKDIYAWNIFQSQAYTRMAHQVKDEVEWLIVTDTDEFLFPVHGKDLKTVLKAYDAYASASVNWRCFGTGDVEKVPEGKLLTETLLKGNSEADPHVKTIVKPRYVKKFSNPHFAELLPGYGQVTEQFEYFLGPFSPNPTKNILRINHYWARDGEFFKTTKLKRVHIIANGLSDEEKKNKIEALTKTNQLYSSQYDDSIMVHVPELRKRMGFSLEK